MLILEEKLHLPSIKEELSSASAGIILLGFYFLFEFGSLQGLYSEIMRPLRLPFILAVSTLFYALFVLVFRNRSVTPLVSRSFLIYILFVLIYGLITTRDPLTRVNSTKLFISYLEYYIVMTYAVKSLNSFLLLIDIWLASVAYSSLHGILQGGLVWGNQWLSDENQFSLLLSTAVPVSYFLFLNSKIMIKKACYLFCLSLYVIGIVASTSRGGFLALAVAGLFIWALGKHKIKTIMIFITAVILAYSFAPPQFFSEIKTIGEGAKERTANERTYLWSLACKMFLDKPVLGVGISNYPEFVDIYDNKAENRFSSAVNWKGTLYVAHSTPFTILAEGGIVQVLLIVFLMAVIYKNWKKINRYIRCFDKEHQKSAVITFIANLNNALFIAMLSYWIGASFITVDLFPFFWVLTMFSLVFFNIAEATLIEYEEQLMAEADLDISGQFNLETSNK